MVVDNHAGSFMKQMMFFVAVFWTAAAAVSPVSEAAVIDPLKAAIDKSIATVKPALVQIHVVSTTYRSGREIKHESTGSGTIISPAGHIVTNHHVAGHAARLLCLLSTKEKMEAELIGTDPLTDIAVIRLESEPGRTFPFASFGDSSRVQVGDRVLSMGSPVSLSQSVTLGVVSNIGMSLPHLLKKGRYQLLLDGENVGTFVLWIGHDAAIFRGNSGGPLVNLEGSIVGINEIGIGLGGAIPSNLAKEVVRQIIETGKVARSWTGWEVQPQLQHPQFSRGVLLSGVVTGSPAEKAGFTSGDLLLKIGDTTIKVSYPEELPLFHQMEAALPVLEEIPVEFLRNNRKMVLNIFPVEREPAQYRTVELMPWGMTVRDISYLASREMKRSSQEGVLVTSVRPGGPSGQAKVALNSGDVIIRIDQQPVENVSALRLLTDRIVENQTEPTPTIVEFERQGQRLMSIVSVGLRDLRDQGLEVRKAWLPAATQVITREMAQALEIPDMMGVRITQVYPDSSAEKAGLAVGDLVLKMDGQTIPAAAPEDYEVFPSMIRQYKIGTTLELEILRDKKALTIPVELVRSPRLPREMSSYNDKTFEFTVRDLSFQDKAENKLDGDQQGVWVEEVTPGSWAALGELSVGDLILEIENTAVIDTKQFEMQMEKIRNDRKPSLILHVLRGVHHIFLELKSDWQ